MYLSLSLSLSLSFSSSLSFFWSGHVSSSPWSNVSRVANLWGHSVVVFSKGPSLSESVSQWVSDKVTYWAVGWTAKNVIFWNFKPKQYPLQKCDRLEFQTKMWSPQIASKLESSEIASKNGVLWNFHQKCDILKFQTKMRSPEISNQIKGLNCDAENQIICVFFIWYHFNLSINQLLKNCRFHSKIWSSVDVLLFWARLPQTKWYNFC